MSRRRPILLIAGCALLAILPACGSSSSTDGSTASSAAGSATTDSAASTGTDSSAAPSTDGSSASSAAPDSTGEPVTTKPGVPKPEVKVPTAAPTELQITDLTAGTGAKAADGDTLMVHYVGVRTADGSEFDNSYDRGEALPVTLGTGGVIKGWEQGLVGAQAGGRRQLDIPADLAYGDNPPAGSSIQAGDALTFVIDVLAVIPKSDPANAPSGPIKGGDPAAELATDDVTTGTGDAAALGDRAVIQLVAYRGDTGEQIDSTWTANGPVPLLLDPSQVVPGLVNGIVGMSAGGRRQITIPYKDAWGDEGNSQIGLPAKTDLVVIVDLLALY